MKPAASAKRHHLCSLMEAGVHDRGARIAREDAVAALLALWAVIGLALDGRAHEDGGVESFFTVWHLILYSGLAAAAAWTLRGGLSAVSGDRVRLVSLAGLGLLAVGGPFDLVWHEVFGFEVSLEALLSPSHLLLLAGGLLLVTQPLRSAWRRPTGSLTAAVASLVLATALVAFFLQYLTPFHDAEEIYTAAEGEQRVRGVASLLVTGVLLSVPLLLLIARFGAPPRGAVLGLFGGVAAVLMVASHDAPLVLLAAAMAGGAAAELLAWRLRPGPHRPGPLRAFAALAALTFTASMLLGLAIDPGLNWPPELWTGSALLVAGIAYALALLVTTRPRSTT